MWHVSINWEVGLKTDHFAPVETINEGMEMDGFHQFQSNIAFDIKTSHFNLLSSIKSTLAKRDFIKNTCIGWKKESCSFKVPPPPLLKRTFTYFDFI